jgi:hypothetical protein
MASAWNGEEFALHRELADRARSEDAASMAMCFAICPVVETAPVWYTRFV